MNKKAMALTQSTLLILGILSFAFLIGGTLPSASASDELANSCEGKQDYTSCSDSLAGNNGFCLGGECVSKCGLTSDTAGLSCLSETLCESTTIKRGYCLGSTVCCSPKSSGDELASLESNTVTAVDSEKNPTRDFLNLAATGARNAPEIQDKAKEILDKINNAQTPEELDAAMKEAKEKAAESRKALKEMEENALNSQPDSRTQELIDSQRDLVESYEEALNTGTRREELLGLTGSSSFLGKFVQGFFKKLPMKSGYVETGTQIAKENLALETLNPEEFNALVKENLNERVLNKYLNNELTKEEVEKKLLDKETSEVLGKTTSTLGYAVYAAAWASMGAAISNYALKAIGASERNQRMIASGSWVAAGTTAVAATLIASTPSWATSLGFVTSTGAAMGPPGWMVAGATVVLTAIWGAFNYQNYSQEIFTFNSQLWQPQKGGELCQECNALPYGCSEYQCRSYGAACSILNPGTEYEACEWNNSDDFNPPLISQLDNLDVNYEYDPMEDIQLPDRGVQVIYTGTDASSQGCIPAFTGVKFGVKTDEPAQCKIDLKREYDFSQMMSFMSEGSVYTYNHTLSIPSSAFPSEFALNESGWTIDTGKDQEFFIRCEDANGNLNPMHFVVSFCVDDGPDTTPPIIETNYLKSAYVTSGTMFVDDLEVYTNEPAECRWDFVDREYDTMEYGMTGCSESLGEYTFPSSYQYGCFGNLTGIEDGKENNYYIRCKDKPTLDEQTAKERRVSNSESYKLTLVGTKPLAIDAITVNDEVLYEEDFEEDNFTMIDSTTPVTASITVKTSQGAEKNGNARCSYARENDNLFFEFYNDGDFDYNYLNTHDLYLGAGSYNYDIRCCDLANNCDTEQISFEVETDLQEPQVSRAYFEDKKLKLITSESAECVYSTSTCNYLFEDGLSLETTNNENHYLNWDTTTDLHIKCRDKFGNLPDPKECQITVRAYEQYEEEEE